MAKFLTKILFNSFMFIILPINIFADNNCESNSDDHLVASTIKEQCLEDENDVKFFPLTSDYDANAVPPINSNDFVTDRFDAGSEIKSKLEILESFEEEHNIRSISDKDSIIRQGKSTAEDDQKEVKLNKSEIELRENSESVVEKRVEVSTPLSSEISPADLNTINLDEVKQISEEVLEALPTESTENYIVIPTAISPDSHVGNASNNDELQTDQYKENSTVIVESEEVLKGSDKFLSDKTNIKYPDEGIKASKLVGEYQPLNDEKDNEFRKQRIFYEASTELEAKITDHYPNNKPFDAEEKFEKQLNKDNWKFNFGDLSEACADCDLGILPIRAAAQKDKFKDISVSIPEVSIQFADVPRGNEFQVDKLDLSEGTFLFNYLGEFLSWLQPNDFPVGLMRDALRNQITITELITQSLQLEAGFVACLVVGVLFALAAPIVVFSHTCYRLRRRNGDDNGDNLDDNWARNCRRRTVVLILQILIILLLTGVIGILVTNQQVGEAMLQSEKVLHTVLGDLDTFLGNAHLQMHFAVTKHLEQAVQAVDSDLNNVEVLLGQPIQVELSRETGVDVALDSLRNIAQDANKVAELVELVQLAAGLVGEAMLLTREKLSDLRLQVDSFKRQCAPRDRPLCDTISINGLDITMNIDFLRQDEKLKRVRQLGGPELRSAVESTRILYKDIPRRVDVDTRTARQDVHRQLDQQRTRIDEDIRTLETFFRGLRSKVVTGQNSLDDFSSNVPEIEFYRWIIGLGTAGSVFLVWILLQSGISCGCCGSEKSAAPTLLVCVMVICLVSTALWMVALIVLIVGGHGQVFVCRPLYQEPDFPALSELLDQPGLFPSHHNFLSSLAYNNETMDVPLNRILRECQTDKAAYPTFQLKSVFNVDTMSESRQWDQFNEKMQKINIKLDHVKLLSPELYAQLDELLQVLSVNLTAHRIQLSEPLTGKDLNAFAAQLDSVGNQLKDLATVSRIETLASRTRRLIATHIDPLKEKKENLVYQLTALEVQLGPLHHQVEQSISHLKTIQFFLNSQGNSIADKKTLEYKNRLTSYIDQYRIHLTEMVNNDIARCQPLWNLFHTTRLMLCKHVMDPLNGFWFSIVWCLVILLCATPICLKLVDYYRLRSHSDMTNLSGSPSENLMSNEQGKDWATPNSNADAGGAGGW